MSIKRIIFSLCSLLLLFLSLPLAANAASTPVPAPEVSPAQQALNNLTRLEKTAGYKDLQSYVRQLAAKRRASASQKSSYRRELSARRANAGKEVATRNKIRRAAAWETNRQKLAEDLQRAFVPYQLEIQQLTLETEGDIIAVRAAFRQEAQAVREEWAPRVRRAKREAQSKIARAKRYIAGAALRKYKKKAWAPYQALLRARENYIKTEVWPIHENEIEQLRIQLKINVQEVRDEFNTEVRPELQSKWQQKFDKQELPRLKKIVDGENEKLNALVQRGKKIIDAL